jgi:Tfp pilus assembly protein FimT
MIQKNIRKPKSNRGFTLVEALSVLIILIVVAAVSLPLLARSSSFTRIRSDVFELAGRLTQAKFRASTELTAYRVRFDTVKNVYVLERREGGVFVADEPEIGLRGGITFAGPEDLSSFAASPAGDEQLSPATQSPAIGFNSRGIPIDSTGRPLGDNAIYLRNDRKDYFAVTVSLAGLVEVWHYLPDGTWVTPD